MKMKMKIKFPKGCTVRHVKTGVLYVVLLAPDEVALERGKIPVYVYRECDTEGQQAWVCKHPEMEDGRFIRTRQRK